MWYNSKHYPDPTAGAAFARIGKEERRLNSGKEFESDWRRSVPPDVWYYRLRDSSATFYGGAQEGIRFAPDNICDCVLYRWPYLHLVELKTVAQSPASLSAMFGRFDPEKERYKKQKHLEDMDAAAAHPGVVASVVINYRGSGHTYAVSAGKVLSFLSAAIHGHGRKSIPESWCQEHGVLIPQQLLRVHYRYDVREMMTRTEGRAEDERPDQP